MRRPLDTSPEAHARQLAAYRAMRPEERLRLAGQLSDDIRSLARSGIRARGIEGASEADLDAQLARVLHGADLAAATREHPPGRR